MSRRRAAANGIRGPHSALTDFLSSHGISAQQINQDYQRRVQEAENQAGPADDEDENKENEDGDEEDVEDIVERKKRKRKEEKMLMKVKQSKEFKKRKFQQQKHGEVETDDDALARSMLAKNKPLPGQLDNCEICEKRFTVTPYSKTGPDGGLLCGKCSKELKDDEKKAQAASKKKPQQKARRRQTESDRMMGDVRPGAKSLVSACVRKVADVVNDVDDFGDMPEILLHRLSQILSKNRVLNSRTLSLFIRDDSECIDVYDCGKLEEEDFVGIFHNMPQVEKINLRFAGQLKDDPLLWMIKKCDKLRHLHLGATNLISDQAWTQLFQQRGAQLESLKLSELNNAFGDDIVQELAKHCINLKRLKLRSCSYMGEKSIEVLSQISTLEHLTLSVAQSDTSPATLENLITTLGPNLKTLCLEGFNKGDETARMNMDRPASDSDDEDDAAAPDDSGNEEAEAWNRVIYAIYNNCTQLRKLRFTGNNYCTDLAYADLFSADWANGPLRVVDLSNNRHIDSTNPEGSEDNPSGFCSQAFKALMAHSGSQMEHLNLQSCRHISHQALAEMFDGEKRYPALKTIDLSFVTHVDEEVTAGIFRSCPELTKLVVFACFNARSAQIPAGVAVVGLPNAQDSIIVER